MAGNHKKTRDKSRDGSFLKEKERKIMFCQSCGTQINDNEKFCANCGSPAGTTPIVPPLQQQSTQDAPPPVQTAAPQYSQQTGYAQQGVPPQTYTPQDYAQQNYTQQNYAQQNYTQQNYAQQYPPQGMKPMKKSPILLYGIIGIVVLGLVAVGAFYLFRPKAGISSKSSIVSKGVNTDDLGNIMNGQYYFDDGTNQYYSSFDAGTAAHIYKVAKGSTKATPIFDGFGWSLVVNNNWLYFSGNEGKSIDGTYNLFRMKTDGTGLENINNGYCYGMNIYKQYLYFIRRPSKDSDESYVYRSDLDGKNETVVVTGKIYYFIVFESKLYYLDSQGDLYSAKDDGTGATKISKELLSRFVIGNGKIVYETRTGVIGHMNIDGTSPVVVRNAGAKPIAAMNSYKGTIYYAEYDKTAVEGTYAYNYYLYSVKFDGTVDTLIYTSLSYGTYINIINNKVFALDYARDPATGMMPAIARNMDLNGGNVKDLFR